MGGGRGMAAVEVRTNTRDLWVGVVRGEGNRCGPFGWAGDGAHVCVAKNSCTRKEWWICYGVVCGRGHHRHGGGGGEWWIFSKEQSKGMKCHFCVCCVTWWNATAAKFQSLLFSLSNQVKTQV